MLSLNVDQSELLKVYSLVIHHHVALIVSAVKSMVKPYAHACLDIWAHRLLVDQNVHLAQNVH